METKGTPCVICGSEDTKAFSHAARDKESLSLIKCNNCLHTFQPDEEFKDIYSTGEFTQIARNESKTPTSEKIKQLDKKAVRRYFFFEELIKDFHQTLEIGSSIGSFVSLLKLRGIDASGLEPDPDYAAFSEGQYGFKQDAFMLESYQTDKKFDSCCSFHVLEHVRDPKAFVKHAYDLLEEDGKILFEMPSLEIHSYGDWKHTFWSPHVHYFTLSSLYHLFSQYFKVEKIGFYGLALYIYGSKKTTSQFDESEFKSLKSKSKRIKSWTRITPSMGMMGHNKTFLRQMLLQPFFQKNMSKVFSNYYKIGSYHTFKNKSYIRSEKKGSGGAAKAFHVSYYDLWENAGDTILSQCVRRNFNNHFKQSWELERVTNKVTNETISKINASKYLLIGGGGLLLPDSNPNTISGWQWAVSEEQLNQINVPLLVYSIGFNYFHGQTPDEFFIKNLNLLIEKSSFFGLRNLGSIESVKRLVREDLHHKISWQPCTTTVIRKTFPSVPAKPKGPTKKVGVNLAYDRYRNRFDGKMHETMNAIAQAMKALNKMGYEIYVISHLGNDILFGLSLDALGIDYKLVDLQYASPAEAYELFNEMDLVFGARGHAQMVPFGVNTKILSLGSHNKVKFFLEDLEAGDWFIDIRNDIDTITDRIVDTFERVAITDSTLTEERLHTQQEKLWKQTEGNFDVIAPIIG